MQTIIFILGMHRSGTSALARLTHALGADLGKELVAAAPDNPEGFWEHARLVDFNNQIFEALGLHWDATVTLPENWLEYPEIRRIHAKALHWLQQEFQHAPLVVLKDPRTCRTAPFWIRIAEEINAKPVFIHMFRSFAEMAKSFAARGTSLEKALILNALHVIEAENATRNYPRIALDYADLLSSAQKSLPALFSLPVDWAITQTQAHEKLSTVIKNTLRNQTASLSDLNIDSALLASTKELEDIVTAWYANGKIDKVVQEKLSTLYQEIIAKITDAQKWFGFWHTDAMKAHNTAVTLHARNLALSETQSMLENYQLHAKQLEELQKTQATIIAEKEAQIAQTIEQNRLLQETLNAIYTSKGWKVVEKIRCIKLKLLSIIR